MRQFLKIAFTLPLLYSITLFGQTEPISKDSAVTIAENWIQSRKLKLFGLYSVGKYKEKSKKKSGGENLSKSYWKVHFSRTIGTNSFWFRT